MRKTNLVTEPVWSSFWATTNGSTLNSSEKWTNDLQVAVIWLMGGEKITPTSIRHPKNFTKFSWKNLFFQIGVSLCLYHFIVVLVVRKFRYIFRIPRSNLVYNPLKISFWSIYCCLTDKVKLLKVLNIKLNIDIEKVQIKQSWIRPLSIFTHWKWTLEEISLWRV